MRKCRTSAPRCAISRADRGLALQAALRFRLQALLLVSLGHLVAKVLECVWVSGGAVRKARSTHLHVQLRPARRFLLCSNALPDCSDALPLLELAALPFPLQAL